MSGAAKARICSLADAAGFVVYQMEEGTWTWRAEGGLGRLFRELDALDTEAGFASDHDAARGALLALTIVLDGYVDSPEFEGPTGALMSASEKETSHVDR